MAFIAALISKGNIRRALTLGYARRLVTLIPILTQSFLRRVCIQEKIKRQLIYRNLHTICPIYYIPTHAKADVLNGQTVLVRENVSKGADECNVSHLGS